MAADASTSSRPLEGFTPRRGAGLAIFGRSNVEPPAKPVRWQGYKVSRDSFVGCLLMPVLSKQC